MSKQVLITGGAGFVGSHLADELLAHGFRVRALDNLAPQVHARQDQRPTYLDREVELVVGDVRDRDTVRRALQDVDYVCHLAAVVGVGQSMYEVENYTSINNIGTAVLAEALIERNRKRPVEGVLVASSMSIYGEGLYVGADGEVVAGVERSAAQLEAHDWEVRSAEGERLRPIPTPEWKTPALPSIYALSKYDQERMLLVLGRAYKIPTVAMRYFNIYGTRQALSNPYTGVLAIFASRFLNGKAPLINEDGRQQRDFVSVYDVSRACRLALETPEAAGQVFNVGSGRQFDIAGIAHRMADVLGCEHLRPEITGKCRVGVIRHCFADISLARRVLGYEPRVTLEEGLVELAGWLEGQVALDRVEEARAELAQRGLAV